MALIYDPIIHEAKMRYQETEAYQARLVSKYRKYHHWYAPANDDQWPEDQVERPGKIHITNNIIKPVVDIESRLQAILPRIVLIPADQSSLEERARAEFVEKQMVSYLEMSDWETWTQVLSRAKSIYGKGILKTFWNTKDKRPDVLVVENPANLRIGWGASDFSSIDWAIYEYSLSPFEVMRRWPDMMVVPTPYNEPLLIIQANEGTQDDPLAQRTPERDVIPTYQPSDYERKQVQVWDYWYKDEHGDVYNCIILQRQVHAVPPQYHKELGDIPYIPIENDHEPGSPEGMSTIGALVDIQIEMNRSLSHWTQLIVDESDPAWQIDADYIPAGMVPKSGEITAAGEGHTIGDIPKNVNIFPIDQLHQALWFNLHRVSGLPEVAFGSAGGSQVSARALAVQIEGTANRLDHKRNLLYAGYRQLLQSWSSMIINLNPSIDVPGFGKVEMAPLFNGLNRWQIVAPEITPRHVIEHTMNTINKVNSGVLSAHTAMDELGIDSPEDELRLIAEERSNIALNPGIVTQQLAAVGAAQQMQITQMQLQQQQGPAPTQAALAPGAGQGAQMAQMQQAHAGQGAQMAQMQQAQPTPFEDMNEEGGQLPATAQGSAPPGKSALTTLVRSNPQGEGQTLNQISMNRPL